MAILCQEMLPANRKAQCSTIEMKEPERLEDHDEPIELHRAGQLQRSPETMRNIQLFVNNFEDVNLKDDFEPSTSSSLERKFPKLNKYYQASSFSIDSWSIDSSVTEDFEGFENIRHTKKLMPSSHKKTIIIASTILACTIMLSIVLGLGFLKPIPTQKLPRTGK